MKFRQFFTIFTVLSIITLGLSGITEGGNIGERESKITHLNLKAQDKLSPEYEHNVETEAQTKNIRAQYDDYGLILNNPQWVDVGTWTSEGVDGKMTLKGTVEFKLYYIETSNNGNGNSHEWQFDFQYNGETVAHAEQDSEGSTEEIRIVSAQAQLNESITSSKDDTFSVYIRVRGFEDIDVYYDNITYDSGASVETDSLVINKANSQKKAVNIVDIWGINWESQGKYFCSISVNGQTYMGNDDTTTRDAKPVEDDTGSAYMTKTIIFKGVKIPEGSTVDISVSYAPNETTDGWSYTYKAGGKGDAGNYEEDDDIEMSTVAPMGALIVLIALLGYFFMRRRNAEDEPGEDEYYEEDYSEEDVEEEDSTEEEFVED